MSNNHRILLAIDASPASRRAAEYVADMLGGRAGLHVGLLHLELPPHMLEWGGSENPSLEDKVETERDAAYQQMEHERIKQGKTLLEAIQPILTAKGIEVNAQMVRFEEPLDRRNVAHEILRAAREHNYGTIVVGRRSFSAWQRLFNRHVGEELVRAGTEAAIWIVG